MQLFSATEWFALIGLTGTALGLLGAGLIYIIRLEGKTELLAAQMARMDTKMDQILVELLGVVKTIVAPSAKRRRQPRAVAAGKGRVGKPTTKP